MEKRPLRFTARTFSNLHNFEQRGHAGKVARVGSFKAEFAGALCVCGRLWVFGSSTPTSDTAINGDVKGVLPYVLRHSMMIRLLAEFFWRSEMLEQAAREEDPNHADKNQSHGNSGSIV